MLIFLQNSFFYLNYYFIKNIFILKHYLDHCLMRVTAMTED
jgi:hypothetical protein